MAEPWSFQTEFGHYVYPVLGIYSDTIAEMKSEYGRRVARTLVDHFTTFKTDDTFDKAPKTKELEQLWYPVRRNWKVVDLKDVIQKKKDLTKEKGMILHSSWIEKFQNLPSVTISFYELDDEQAIVEKIKKIIENNNVLHTVVVILDQKQYETYGTDARLSHICKESGIDMHHLAVSRPGNREYIEEFLNGLELGLRTDAILYYSGRIAEKQQKLADLINLDARNDIQPRFQNDREREKSADREKDSNAVTTGKLVRQYLKLSYFAECSEDNETKKHCIKEGYRQIQTYLRELIIDERYQSKEAESNTDVGVSGDTDTPTENDVLDKVVYKEWEKSAKTLEFTKNKEWIEGINVMNTLCLRMEREAIKEKQESPRSQHLENFRQLLELSGIDTNHVWYYLMAHILASFIPIYKVVLANNLQISNTSLKFAVTEKLVDIINTTITNAGSIELCTALTFVSAARIMKQQLVKGFEMFNDTAGQIVSVDEKSVWNQGLYYALESRQYYTSERWSIRVDSVIAECLLYGGSEDSGIKKFRLLVNSFREQRWYSLLVDSLLKLKDVGDVNNRFRCLVELSAIGGHTFSGFANAWQEILENEEGVDVEIDLTAMVPIFNISAEFLDIQTKDRKKVPYKVEITTKMSKKIEANKVVVELDPPGASDLVVDDVVLESGANSCYRLYGLASIGQNSLNTMQINRVTVVVQGKGGRARFVHEFKNKWSHPHKVVNDRSFEVPKTIWQRLKPGNMMRELGVKIVNLEQLNSFIFGEKVGLKVLVHNTDSRDEVRLRISKLEVVLLGNVGEKSAVLKTFTKSINHVLSKGDEVTENINIEIPNRLDEGFTGTANLGSKNTTKHMVGESHNNTTLHNYMATLKCNVEYCEEGDASVVQVFQHSIEDTMMVTNPLRCDALLVHGQTDEREHIRFTISNITHNSGLELLECGEHKAINTTLLLGDQPRVFEMADTPEYVDIKLARCGNTSDGANFSVVRYQLNYFSSESDKNEIGNQHTVAESAVNSKEGDRSRDNKLRDKERDKKNTNTGYTDGPLAVVSMLSEPKVVYGQPKLVQYKITNMSTIGNFRPKRRDISANITSTTTAMTSDEKRRAKANTTHLQNKYYYNHHSKQTAPRSITLDISMVPMENVVFSGHKRLTYRLLPGKSLLLSYIMVFLSYNQELPKLLVTCTNTPENTPANPNKKNDAKNRIGGKLETLQSSPKPSTNANTNTGTGTGTGIESVEVIGSTNNAGDSIGISNNHETQSDPLISCFNLDVTFEPENIVEDIIRRDPTHLLVVPP